MKNIYYIAVILLVSSHLFANEQRKETGDYNFDGHEDYRVFVLQNGSMALWDYFLFDPKENKYKKYNALTDLWNPNFKKEAKQIIMFAPGGHAGAIFEADANVWKEGDIQLIESTKQDWDKKTELYVNVVSKLTNGVMRVNKILLLNAEEAKDKSLEFFD